MTFVEYGRQSACCSTTAVAAGCEWSTGQDNLVRFPHPWRCANVRPSTSTDRRRDDERNAEGTADDTRRRRALAAVATNAHDESSAAVGDGQEYVWCWRPRCRRGTCTLHKCLIVYLTGRFARTSTWAVCSLARGRCLVGRRTAATATADPATSSRLRSTADGQRFGQYVGAAVEFLSATTATCALQSGEFMINFILLLFRFRSASVQSRACRST